MTNKLTLNTRVLHFPLQFADNSKNKIRALLRKHEKFIKKVVNNLKGRGYNNCTHILLST